MSGVRAQLEFELNGHQLDAVERFLKEKLNIAAPLSLPAPISLDNIQPAPAPVDSFAASSNVAPPLQFGSSFQAPSQSAVPPQPLPSIPQMVQQPPVEQYAPAPAPVEPSPLVTNVNSDNILVSADQLAQQPPPSPWKKIFSTSAEDHNKSYVQTVLHTPKIKNVLNNEMGWFLSTSKGMFNLWRCDGSDAAVPLECWHSQVIDYRVLCWDILDVGEPILLSAAAPTNKAKSKKSYIVLYSLDGEQFFVPRGIIEPPENVTQVVSLAKLGGPLTTSFACSVSNMFAVYDLMAGVNADPKAICQNAHNERISSVQTGRFGVQLFTGAMDGVFKVWDMRQPPNQPTCTLKGHTYVATGLETVNDVTIVTGSADSQVLIWDLRNPTSPMRSMSPDSNAVLTLSSTPDSKLISVTTLTGLHVLNVDTNELIPVSQNTGSVTYPDSAWNYDPHTKDVLLYGATLKGNIDVFVKPLM